MLKSYIGVVSLRKEMFKYPNSTPINTESFCDKILHLTDYACSKYQVRDNIRVVGSKPLARFSHNSTLDF